MLHGKKVLIKTGGHIVAACKTLDIDHQCDLIERSSPDSGSSRTFMAGRKDWSVTSNHLVLHLCDFMLSVGQMYELEIEDRQTLDEYTILKGNAICQKAKITADTGSLVKGTFIFKGSGELTKMLRPTYPFTLNVSELGSPDVI